MFSNVRHITILSVFLVIAISFHIYFIATGYGGDNLNVIINYALPIYLYGAFICFYRAKDIKGAMGKSHIFLGISFLLYSIGLFIFTTLSIEGNGVTPYPSIADVFYILFYPLFLVGIFFFLRNYEFSFKKRQVIFSIIAVAVSAWVSVYLLGLPGEGVSTVERVFDYIYIIADTILLSVALFILNIAGGSISRGLSFIIIGIAIQACADFVFAIRLDGEIYIDGDISDLLYALSGYFLAIGIVLSVSIQKTFSNIDVDVLE